MELKKLFQMQRALDSHIEEKHELENEDLFDKKVLALLVEIGELANETRCFKFWSVKPSSPKDVVLEEFVDGVHFILSLGLECGFDQKSIAINDQDSARSVTEQFLHVYESINHFQKNKAFDDYVELVESYLKLSSLLGFTNEDIEKAYFAKNEVNYQRQQNNY
ncbi:dUTP diphosphatase [Neobacillus cucumis]|uniref:dUTP diphosphatase n=1 Tax=Neobacillus cucumis TaxID=1740721 RepID=UPI00204171A1|nr:dUTP diphosphatase [Neobacillus cucumis]MCM3725357.1 dUTP diphosphatase [Neobacillus cucumis]